MRTFLFLFCAVVAMLLPIGLVPTKSQSMSLPANLIMTAGSQLPNGKEQLSLVMWDAGTNTFSPFYADPTPNLIALKALGWSPNRQWLAVYRDQEDFPNGDQATAQICILRPNGQMQACSEYYGMYTVNSSENAFDYAQEIVWSTLRLPCKLNCYRVALCAILHDLA